jgi:hypothetical protein
MIKVEGQDIFTGGTNGKISTLTTTDRDSPNGIKVVPIIAIR